MAIVPVESYEMYESPEATHDRGDEYVHYAFTEGTDLDSAKAVWRLHAEGYRSMGFVTESAVNSEGYLSRDIDKSRGPNVDYYVAFNPDNEKDSATIRLVNIPESGTYADLPGYKICGDILFPAAEQYIKQASDEARSVKELSALARGESARPLSVHEIFRNIIHEAQGKDELWFSAVVSSTYDSLAKSYGASNFEVVGQDVPVGQPNVNEQIVLRPMIVHPDLFIDKILDSCLRADTRIDRMRLRRSFMFMTEGLQPEEMSETVQYYRAEFAAEAAAKNGAA